MKTKALLLAVALFAAGSTAAFAATDSNKDNNKAGKDKTECAKGKKDGHQGQCREGFNPFEGLNLTEAQQTKLKELRTQGCPMKAQMKEGKKAEGQKLDRKQIRAERTNAKREFLGKVKAILTPEQYVTFLENMTINGDHGDRGSKHMMMHKGQKHGKDSQKKQSKDKN